MHLERDLLSSELSGASLETTARATTAATVTEPTATTTTATATTTTVAEATTTATATAEARATTSATATEATSVAVVTGSGVVETDVAAVDVGTVHGLKSTSGLLDRGELNVTVALGGASVTVGGETDAVDVAVLAEVASEAVLGSVEGKVAAEESGRGNALLVTVGLGAVVGAVATVLLGLAGRAEVASEGAAVNLDTVLVVESLNGSVGVGELDVGEALGATRVGVGDDADGDGRAVLELTAEPVLVNVP